MDWRDEFRTVELEAQLRLSGFQVHLMMYTRAEDCRRVCTDDERYGLLLVLKSRLMVCLSERQRLIWDGLDIPRLAAFLHTLPSMRTWQQDCETWVVRSHPDRVWGCADPVLCWPPQNLGNLYDALPVDQRAAGGLGPGGPPP